MCDMVLKTVAPQSYDPETFYHTNQSTLPSFHLDEK